MSNLIAILKETFSSSYDTVSAALPQIMAAAIVVVAGLLVARIARSIVLHGLRLARFETLAERVGMNNILSRAEIERSSSDVIGMMTYWTLILFTGLVALGVLGMADASTFAVVGQMIPNVVVGVAILILGLNVSAFLAKLIQTAAVNAEVRQVRFVHNAAYYGMATLVAIVALKQIGVPGDVLGTAFTMFFGGTCLALALAFGLGGRELAGQIVSTTYREENDRAGRLRDASELGTEVFPVQKLRKPTRMRSKVAA